MARKVKECRPRTANQLEGQLQKQNLNVAKCVISHVTVKQVVQGRRRTYRAHGRVTT